MKATNVKIDWGNTPPHVASRDVTSALSNFYGGENRLLVFLGKYSGATLKINVDGVDAYDADGGGED